MRFRRKRPDACYCVASQALLHSRISSRRASGWARCASRIGRSPGARCRNISATLRYWPDLASSNARSIADAMHQPAITNRAQKGMSAFEPVQSFATPLRWRRLRSCAPRRLSYLAAYAFSLAQHGLRPWRCDLVAQCVGGSRGGRHCHARAAAADDRGKPGARVRRDFVGGCGGAFSFLDRDPRVRTHAALPPVTGESEFLAHVPEPRVAADGGKGRHEQPMGPAPTRRICQEAARHDRSFRH